MCINILHISLYTYIYMYIYIERESTYIYMYIHVLCIFPFQSIYIYIYIRTPCYKHLQTILMLRISGSLALILLNPFQSPQIISPATRTVDAGDRDHQPPGRQDMFYADGGHSSGRHGTSWRYREVKHCSIFLVDISGIVQATLLIPMDLPWILRKVNVLMPGRNKISRRFTLYKL